MVVATMCSIMRTQIALEHEMCICIADLSACKCTIGRHLQIREAIYATRDSNGRLFDLVGEFHYGLAYDHERTPTPTDDKDIRML